MIYDWILRPALFRFDPERVHERLLALLSRGSVSKLLGFAVATIEDPVELWGLRFRNPLGLAAGFDKDARAIAAWHELGFGFVEVGTVTREPQPGNPRPRIFRAPRERALVNRLGFPSEGADQVAARLERYRARHVHADFPIAVNIGKSKATPNEVAAADYLYSFRRLHDVADLFVVNVSSPNTPGLRELQSPERLRPILSALKEEARARAANAPAETKPRPILVKIAPDLTDAAIDEILALVADVEIDGIVATNTTVDHSSITLRETGGLSGAPLRARSTAVIRRIAERTAGRLPIIGVGGVFTHDDYQEKRDAGASLVEIYTGFVYEGPRAVARILGRKGE